MCTVEVLRKRESRQLLNAQFDEEISDKEEEMLTAMKNRPLLSLVLVNSEVGHEGKLAASQKWAFSSLRIHESSAHTSTVSISVDYDVSRLAAQDGHQPIQRSKTSMKPTIKDSPQQHGAITILQERTAESTTRPLIRASWKWTPTDSLSES